MRLGAENPDTQQEEVKLKREEFFQFVGQFSVEFEQVCCKMEECAMDILEREGLRNRSIRKILLANQTAEPLRSLLQALLAEFFDQEGFQVVLKKVFQEMQDLTAIRNEIIHTKWCPPLDDPDWGGGKSHVIGQKLKTSKSGESSVYPKYNRADFEEKIEACLRLQKIFSSLIFLMEFPDRLNSYLRVSNGTLELYPGD